MSCKQNQIAAARSHLASINKIVCVLLVGMVLLDLFLHAVVLSKSESKPEV
jgi:hypothetical protein